MFQYKQPPEMISLRVPQGTRARLHEAAAGRYRSTNALLVDLIERGLAAEKAASGQAS